MDSASSVLVGWLPEPSICRGLVLAGAVFALPLVCAAQDLDLAELQELDDDRTEITYENLTIDDLEDMDVVRDGEVIGEIEEVLGNQDGEIVAVVVEYGGNILGVGDEEVVVPIEELELTPGENQVEIAMSDLQLAELSVWED